jgi:hypothetical protein
MARRRVAVRLGIPALIVAVLAFIALWRIGPPPDSRDAVATTGTSAVEKPLAPLTTLAEVLTANALGRQASLEGVTIRQIVSERTFWIGSGADHTAFAVFDPDVKRNGAPKIAPGTRLTLIGMVRPAPDPEEAITQWKIDANTAKLLQERGTYLHVTEVRADTGTPQSANPSR